VYLRADSPAELLTLAHDVRRRLEAAPLESAGILSQFSIASLLPDPRVAEARRASLAPDLPQQVENDLRAALAYSDFRPEAYDDYIAFLRRLVARVARRICPI
jgi:hypothetical protein